MFSIGLGGTEDYSCIKEPRALVTASIESTQAKPFILTSQIELSLPTTNLSPAKRNSSS